MNNKPSYLGMLFAFVVMLGIPFTVVFPTVVNMLNNAACKHMPVNFWIENTCFSIPDEYGVIVSIHKINQTNDRLILEVLNDYTGRDILLWYRIGGHLVPIAVTEAFEANAQADSGGNFVLYNYDNGGGAISEHQPIYIYMLDSQITTIFVDDGGLALDPTIGRDGWVAYSAFGDENYQINLLNVYTRQHREIWSAEHSFFPRWSTDGEWLSWSNPDGLVTFFRLESRYTTNLIPENVDWPELNCRITFDRFEQDSCANS